MSRGLNSGSPDDEQQKDPKINIDDLDPDDLEYLIKKGVFDLPPQPLLEILLKAYFEFVYPFSPVLDRVQFLDDYRRGCYSIFLMQAVLTSAVSHAPEHMIVECGYATRATAQQAFFSKAALLCDFFCEKNQLPLLQGCLILGTAMVPRSKDKDVRYWFYNSVRVAIGMELHKSHVYLEADPQKSKLFKRIWWILYSRDIILSLFGTQNIRLLSDREYDIDSFTEDDWESEQLSERDLTILPIMSRGQKMYWVEYCKLAVIGARCLSSVKDHSDDPQTLTDRISAWRLALPDILVHDIQHPENLWSTVLLAISYRFECILLRLLRLWWRRRNASWYEWAKKKLQSAIFELDTITGRTWLDGTLLTLPLSFKSCIHTALAIHIEMALDESGSEINRSMSQLSIQRSMLLLRELKDDPVLQQAIPIFERVLVQTNLIPASLMTQAQQSTTSPPSSQRHDNHSSPSQIDSGADGAILQDSLGEYSLWFKDFLGFDFLDTY
ncbi:hypothetical protein BGZ63DRAFT_423354 [Mariannaea sp. PMI_226]|nr:hypothetical protein BGZ63DRAFT_423354 [Mariannaea sp. PMI_226]